MLFRLPGVRVIPVDAFAEGAALDSGVGTVPQAETVEKEIFEFGCLQRIFPTFRIYMHLHLYALSLAESQC